MLSIDTITGNPADHKLTNGATHVIQGDMIPLGDFQASALNVVKGLATIAGGTIPAGSRAVLIQCSTQPVRFTTDGVTNPTAAIGQKLLVDAAPYLYTGDLTKIRFIETAASATINVAFFR